MSTLAELAPRVESLNQPDAAYHHTLVGSTILVTDEASEYTLTVELDEAAQTFRLSETAPAATPPDPRRAEAGGIYNAAKRAGLRGHMPQRRRVKENLLAMLERSGFKRAR